MIVAGEGTLKWILDAYTATDRYPYALRLLDGTTYMRNSVKLVIDAYDGSLAAYVSAPADPLIRTWAAIFPGIFVPLDSMPAHLRAHIRYPDDIYRIQTGLYTTYHMDEPEDFYHREDQWQIPEVRKADESVPFMRHIIMRLPDEYGPSSSTWCRSRRGEGEPGGVDGGAERRRRLRETPVYRLSRQSLVFGPRQIENRINQNTEIARQVTLWDQRGSQVIRGDLLVIPIEESLVYVQPLYLQAEGGRIPELKRVIVAYQNRVVMQETLEQGLAELFGGARRRPADARRRSRPGRRRRAGGRRHGRPGADRRGVAPYQAALEANRQVDWTRYGEEFRRLGEALERLEAGRRNRKPYGVVSPGDSVHAAPTPEAPTVAPPAPYVLARTAPAPRCRTCTSTRPSPPLSSTRSTCPRPSGDGPPAAGARRRRLHAPR